MKNNSLSFYVQSYFLSYLIAQRGYGDNTLGSYRDTFKMLYLFLKSSGNNLVKVEITHIERTCILRFLEWLETERNNVISTRNQRLAVLKSFFQFVLSRYPELSDQCVEIINIPAKRTQKRPPSHLTEQEVKYLLNAPGKDNRAGLRHMAILALLYDSGCRVQELIDLDVADFTIGRCFTIYVKGKGSKHRRIPIFRETGKILENYIKAYGLHPADPLFTNRGGTRLTRAGICYIMNKYKRKDSHAGSMSPHLLRHSKATHFINENVNIYHVRDFLGHTSVTTTQTYLTSNPEVTRKAIEKASQKILATDDSYSWSEKEDLLTFLETLV